jgi:hypothetical protein
VHASRDQFQGREQAIDVVNFSPRKNCNRTTEQLLQAAQCGGQVVRCRHAPGRGSYVQHSAVQIDKKSDFERVVNLRSQRSEPPSTPTLKISGLSSFF